MASRTWVGRAGAVRQVSPFTLGGTVAVGSTFTVTVNGRAVTVTATGTSAADAAADLALACQGAEEYAEFQELAWEAAGAVLTVTGPEDGSPFTVAVSAGGSGSPTVTPGTVVTGTGPNYWSNATNWAEAAVPATGDDVVVGSGPSILHGLDQSGVTLASITVTSGFPAGASIGLPDRNPAGYAEYRGTRLQIKATLVRLESASERVRLNLLNAASTVTVDGTGRAVTGEFAADLLANHSSTVVRVNAGQVGLAAGANETATVGTVRVAYRDRRPSDVVAELGPGLTITTLEQTGGDVTLRCAITTVTREGGTFTRLGSGTVTTLDNRGGRVNDYGTGTITTLEQGATYNRRGLAPLTVTTARLYPGSAGDPAGTSDPAGTITWTNPVQFIRCGPPATPGDPEGAPPAVHHFNAGYGRQFTPTDV